MRPRNVKSVDRVHFDVLRLMNHLTAGNCQDPIGLLGKQSALAQNAQALVRCHHLGLAVNQDVATESKQGLGRAFYERGQPSFYPMKRAHPLSVCIKSQLTHAPEGGPMCEAMVVGKL